MVLQLGLLVSGVFSARMLGPTNRGYLALLVTSGSTVGQVGAVGISLAATYYLAAGLIGGKEVIGLLRGSAAIQVATLTTINAAFVLGYTFVSGAPILFAACLSLLQVPAACALDYGIAFALGGRRHGVASGVRAVAAVSYAAGLTYLFLRGGGTLDSVAVVFVTSTVLGGTLALALGLRIAYSLRPRKSLVAEMGPKRARRELLAFGRRGYVGYLSPTDTFRLDQLAVGLLLSPRALGLYVVGSAFTNFTRVVAINVGLSGTSEVARHHDPDSQREAARQTLVLSAGLITTITICVGVFAIVAIPLLFGKAYRSSVPVAECLLVASWFLSMKRISVDLMRGAGELRAGTRAEIINLVVFLTLLVPVALVFGGVGVALCLAGSAACGSAYLIRKMHRLGFVGNYEKVDRIALPATGEKAAPEQLPKKGPSGPPPLDYQLTALRQVILRAGQTATRLDTVTLADMLNKLPRTDTDPTYEPLTVPACRQGLEELVAHGELEVLSGYSWRIVSS